MRPARVGVFGGTFDPPHQGHLILAAEAHFQLDLDRLLWVLTPFPPHKTAREITPVDQRLEMVRIAIAENPAFELSRIEIDRPGPHYALDTVLRLREANPGAELIYLIGGDSLHDLPTWHRPGEFLRTCSNLGVMRRPGDRIELADLEAALPGLEAKLRFIDAPLLEISSTQIRERIERGHPFRYYLPPGIFAYIQERGIYRVGSRG